MIILKKIQDLRRCLDSQREKGLLTGFVPTMGALHEGHISLIGYSKQANGLTVCSIFVNPTQFNDPGDFEKYPITIEKDIQLLEEAGCDILFLPAVEEIYPNGLEPAIHYELGYLEAVLDGYYRPGHFQGVCRVVQRLLEITIPDNLYLGQKDYQQCMVITRLVEMMGWKEKLKINICPTLREKDGLAMSSRNVRLSTTTREQAIGIYQCLIYLKTNLETGSLQQLKNDAINRLQQQGFRTDYVEIADAGTLELLQEWDGKRKLVALIAAFIDEVRLIDNMLLN